MDDIVPLKTGPGGPPPCAADFIARANRLLEEARTVRDAHEIRNQARAIEVYLREQNEARETIAIAVEIKIRAERRAGEILLLSPKQRPGEHWNKKRSPDGTVTPSLSELGVTKKQSSLWQRSAQVPEPEFLSHLEAIQREGTTCTTTGLLERVDAAARVARRVARYAAQAPLEADPLVTLHHARFQEVLLEPGSVDWIITDPPYGRDWVDTYREFSGWASRVLRPGGSALVMTGNAAYPDLLNALRTHLTYHWQLCWSIAEGDIGATLPALHVIVMWKPVVWLYRGPAALDAEFINPDRYISPRGQRQKDLHPWQQGEAYFDLLVHKFTRNDHVVCDPFMGSGTTGASCRKFGRGFIGIEQDEGTFQEASRRILSTRGDRTREENKS